jgi:hypothetical protein
VFSGLICRAVTDCGGCEVSSEDSRSERMIFNFLELICKKFWELFYIFYASVCMVRLAGNIN